MKKVMLMKQEVIDETVGHTGEAGGGIDEIGSETNKIGGETDEI